MRLKTTALLFFFLFAAFQLLQAKPKDDFYITDFGAIGNGKTDNAIAIQKAIDACSKSGGGKVIVPAGKIFMAGPFDLKSNI